MTARVVKYHCITERNFSLWFVLFSPVIGILLGILGAFLLYHSKQTQR